MVQWWKDNSHLFPDAIDGSDQSFSVIEAALTGEFGGGVSEFQILKTAAYLNGGVPFLEPSPAAEAAMFDTGYIEQLLARHFDVANTSILLKWREDDAAATKAKVQGDARHHIALAQSALTIGKEALSGAFLAFLSYCRDNAAVPREHLDVARTASDAFIARVGSELEERSLRQENFGFARDEQLKADLHTALDGYIEDAIRGRHGNQQIVEPTSEPPPSATWEPTDEHTFSNLGGISTAGAVGRIGTPPPGAETLAPPIMGRLSVTQDADTISATGFVFPPEWEAQKQELIRQHALLRQTIETARAEIALAEELRRADASIAGIGHNQPPEEVPSVEEIVNDALAGSDAVLVENPTSIRAGVRLLSRTASALEATGRWLAEKTDRYANAFVDQAGKRTADAITITGVVKALGGIKVVVAAIVGLVTGLFALVGYVL